ncbi:hypothetical protein D3C85_1174820 [compost metagenome]
MRTFRDGTPLGTYSTALPVIPKNSMSIRSTPIYVSQNSILYGGTGVTGGTLVDLTRTIAAGATAQQSTVSANGFGQRGVAAGTYYWQLENITNGTATGTLNLFWAEILNLGV